MPITVVCPNCNARSSARDAALGKRVKCPKCGQPLTVSAPTVVGSLPSSIALAPDIGPTQVVQSSSAAPSVARSIREQVLARFNRREGRLWSVVPPQKVQASFGRHSTTRELPIAGSWWSRNAEKFGSAWKLQSQTPSKVHIKSGEVYRFVVSPSASPSELTGLSHLKDTPLHGLSFADAQHLTDADLSGIGDLVELRELFLDGANVSDLPFLRSLHNLEELRLSGTWTGDSALANISCCSRLQVLDLYGCPRVTSAGLRHLCGLGNLVWLNVCWTQIDDYAIDSLLNMRALEAVSVTGSLVTEACEERIENNLGR